MKKVFLVLFLLALAVPTQAAIVGTSTGTGAPPTILGGYAMDSWGSVYTGGASQAGPGGLSLGFSSPMVDDTVGSTWATWSHGYTGDVLYSNGATAVTMTLSSAVNAFLFYYEPDAFGDETVTATAQDGTSFTQVIAGASGATGFGFYGTGGSMITSISLSNGAADDFAIAEIATGVRLAGVPEPSSLLLVGMGLVSLIAFKKVTA